LIHLTSSPIFANFGPDVDIESLTPVPEPNENGKFTASVAIRTKWFFFIAAIPSGASGP
jgi:hypothetical protein